MDLEAKVAFVTGAGSGIGEAGTLRMASEGAHVVVTDRNGAAAEAVAEKISSAGWRAEALELDVTDDAALMAAIEDAANRLKRVDILHSHAGIQI
jgi:NAD(P)-dependent dehydrogenase (short-subunit alcohol dehydrogenase family)